MPALLDEQPFFDDISGLPLVNGSLYIGPQGGDPVASPIVIYSDRALTTPLANPQTLDANGRSPNKIWIPGSYSLRVDDENGVQKLIDLDRGTTAAVGNTKLSSVSGTNTITAAGGISSYSDGEVYIFQAASDNTGAVTLNIDSVGAKAIVTDNQQALVASMFKANASVMVIYNSTNDNFRWVNQNNQFRRWYKGADIGSSSALTLGTDGNYFDVTGTTTITSINTKAIGFIAKLHFDSAVQLTHNGTSLVLPGSVDYTTVPGDEIEFIEYDTGNWRMTSILKNATLTNSVPIGMMAPFAVSAAPSGWLICDGSAVSRTTYAPLFAVLGETYGNGDGSTTFELPDMRGKFMRGLASGSANDPDRASRTDRGDGTTGDNVGTNQTGQYASHTHTLNNATTILSDTGATVNYEPAISANTGSVTISANSSGGNETRPININVLYCIKI